MDKTFLEKRIEAKAREKFEDELTNLANSLRENEIGHEIMVGGVYLRDRSSYEMLPDFSEIKKQVVEKFIKKETNNILNRLSDLEYLLSSSKA